MSASTNSMMDESLPEELHLVHDRVKSFDESLSTLEELTSQLQSVPLNDLHETMSSFDKAKLDLLGAYAVNSLFWMYLNAKGENPKEHPVKQELDRIRNYIGRVKEIQDKQNAPKINTVAAKRFVRSALWMQAQKTADDETDVAAQSSSPVSASTVVSPRVSSKTPPAKKTSAASSCETPVAAPAAHSQRPGTRLNITEALKRARTGLLENTPEKSGSKKKKHSK